MSNRFHSAKFTSFLILLVLFSSLLIIDGQSNAQTDGGDGRVGATPPALNPRPGIPDFEIPETTLTDQWAVVISGWTNPDALAAQLGFENLGQVAELGNTYLFRKLETDTSPTMARAAEIGLRSSFQVLEFEQQVLRQLYPRPVPSDPLVGAQWHLQNTGPGTSGEDANVVPAWNNGFDGTGVVIAIIDDGLQHTHPDLAPNYNAAGSYDFNGGDSDPAPSSTDGHGTAAGGIAAAADDGSCGVGAAFEAQVSGIRLIAAVTTDATDAAALSYERDINDIYSNSWGPSDNGAVLGGPGISSTSFMRGSVDNGRGGLGNIYIFAAGNGLQNFDDSNADGYANSRYTIAVSATMEDGTQAYYSELGSNILVNAPSGNVTTDLMGTSGSNNSQGWSDNCTDAFGGTSSSAPLVSGVIAQMLEANPGLGWRDVQHILVNSSEKNDPTDSSWLINGAGHDYSVKYGFGRIDADAATTLAQTWTNVGPELNYSTPTQIMVQQNIPDGGTYWTTNPAVPPNPGAPVTSTWTVPDNLKVENVVVRVGAIHGWPGDLIVELESPSGTVSQLLSSRRYYGWFGETSMDWWLSSTHFWGEPSAGDWTIRVYDGWNFDGSDVGRLDLWELDIYGTSICDEVTEIDATECDSLVSLYSKANGGSTWANNSDWLTTNTPCSWYGVTCVGGHVTEIDLSSNSIVGTVYPSELSGLTFLQILDLHDNEIKEYTSISDFSVLTSLTYLDLSHNRLDRRLSDYEFPGSLQHLFLNDNDDGHNALGGDTGEPDFEFDTPNLITLNLGDTQVWGGAAAGLPVSLQHLHLNNVQLSGGVQDYSSLTNLLTLDLSDNGLTGGITGAYIPTGLQALNLGENQVSGAMPTLPVTLQTLDLSGNQITGTLSAWPAGLTHVNLSSNQITGTIPAWPAGLTHIDLSSNQITGNIPAWPSGLVDVDLSMNKLDGNIPDVTGMASLETLRLHSNQLGGDVPPAVATLGALTIFDIGYNKLSESDQTLRDFLNANFPQWDDTQTVPVRNIMVRNVMPTSITLTWTVISYTGDSGYYEIDYATNIAGTWTTAGQTADKTISSYPISGLTQDTIYYFRMRTYTEVHGVQQNALLSEDSNIYSYSVVWATISEQELFNQLETEIDNNPSLDIDFALPEFFAGTINITIRTKDGTIGVATVAVVDDGAGFINISITGITIGGAYATTINSELPSLLADSLDALLSVKIDTGHDLDSMFVAENGIYVGFLQP
jgi:subtilisin-like proprotein convertase family protein/Leucine-rich repeat (LRR) protein